MDASDTALGQLDEIAAEFVARLRQGERPTLAEYATKYPEHAELIANILPTLVAIEELKPTQSPEYQPAESNPVIASQQQLGDFRIVREIGRGGMGVVYEAVQESLGRKVALKVLPRHIGSDPDRQARFEREARAAARLHHTNIVPVFGVGHSDGVHYYAMQYIRGLGLDVVLEQLKAQRQSAKRDAVTEQIPLLHPDPAATIAETPVGGGGRANDEYKPGRNDLTEPAQIAKTEVAHLSDLLRVPADPGFRSGSDASRSSKVTPSYYASIARIGLQVSEALQYAHEQGVLHRDIKPSNLLLDTQGVVWVTDFGLAKADDQRNLTHTGDVLGTLRYMAPELFGARADRRSDIYALGLTLYELLALRPAFDALERSQLIQQVLHATPVALQRIEPGIPTDLATIVHKAMEREGSLRYAHAGDLADDLQRFLNDEPIRARPQSSVGRFARWCRKNPVVSSLTILLVSLLAVTAAASAIVASVFQAQNVELAQANANAEQKTTAAVTARADEASARQAADRTARRATALRLAAQARESMPKHPDRALLLALEAIEATRRHGEAVEIAAEQALRDALANTGGTPWHGHHGEITSLLTSSDGRLVVSAGVDETVRIWNASLEEPFSDVVILDTNGPVRALALSPDNQLLAAGTEQGVRVWKRNAEGKWELLQDFDDAANPEYPHVLTFAGRFQLVGAFNLRKEVRVWPVGKTEKGYLSLRNLDGDVAVNFRGDLLATKVAKEQVEVWKLAGEKPDRIHTITTEEEPAGMAFAPVEGWLVLTIRDRFECIQVLDASVPRAVVSAAQLLGPAKATFHDVVALATSGVCRIRLTDPKGKWTLETSGGRSRPKYYLSPVTNLNGPIAAYLNEENIAEVLLGREAEVLRGHENGTKVIALNHIGSVAYTGGADGVIRAWPLGHSKDRVQTIRIFPQSEYGVFDPTAASAALAIRQGPKTAQLTRLNLADNTLTALGELPSPIASMEFDQAGKRLLVAGAKGAELFQWESEGAKSQPIRFPVNSNSPPFAATLSREGRFVALGGAQVSLWDLTRVESDPRRLPMPQAENPTRDNRFMGAGAILAFVAQDRRLIASSHTTGTHWIELSAEGNGSGTWQRLSDRRLSAISPDGRWGTFRGSRPGLVDFEAVDPRQSKIELPEPETVCMAAFSASGNRLATGIPDGTISIWKLMPKGVPQKLHTLRRHASFILGLEFSSDERSLASISKELVCKWRLDAVRPESSCLVLDDTRTNPRVFSMSRDQEWLMVGHHSEAVRLLPLRTGPLEDLARQVAGRSLTLEELKDFEIGRPPQRETLIAALDDFIQRTEIARAGLDAGLPPHQDNSVSSASLTRLRLRTQELRQHVARNVPSAVIQKTALRWQTSLQDIESRLQIAAENNPNLASAAADLIPAGQVVRQAMEATGIHLDR